MNELYPKHRPNVWANIAGSIPIVLAIVFIVLTW